MRGARQRGFNSLNSAKLGPQFRSIPLNWDEADSAFVWQIALLGLASARIYFGIS
jgi:hypothetical protein